MAPRWLSGSGERAGPSFGLLPTRAGPQSLTGVAASVSERKICHSLTLAATPLLNLLSVSPFCGVFWEGVKGQTRFSISAGGHDVMREDQTDGARLTPLLPTRERRKKTFRSKAISRAIG